MKSLFSLTDRVALITGASRGIGESIARTLAAYGAFCILVSRKIDALETVAQKIETQGGKARSLACNLGDLSQLDALCETIQQDYGKLDILVNNAATNPYFGPMTGIDPGRWEKTFDVNLKGPFFLIQKMSPLMAASGRASVINVSSVNGVRPAPMQGVYSITKAAMISMTKGFAKELASRNIRVNALLPGLTETRFSSAITENRDVLDQLCQAIPLGRQAQPSEMAGAALYLAGDAAAYTTGTTIVCDGGMLA